MRGIEVQLVAVSVDSRSRLQGRESVSLHGLDRFRGEDASRGREGSGVAQGLDGFEPGGLAGRVDAEEHPHQGGHAHRQVARSDCP